MPKPVFWWLLATMLTLTACSNQPSQRALHSEQKRTINQWQLSGKIGLRQPGDAVSAQLNWRQCGDYFDIRLTGPLGQGAVHLFGTTNTAILQTPNGIEQGELASLMQRHAGWPIPVVDLASWALGLPAAGKYQTIDNERFAQHGWQLNYPQWQSADNYSLPRKLVATRGDHKVTVIIQQWQLHPDCSKHSR